MSNRISLLGTLLLMLFATACTMAPPRQTPAPVVDRGTGASRPPAADRDTVEVYPIPDEPLIVIPRSERVPVAPLPSAKSPAVVALLQSAGEQQRAGNLDNAAATLERALRIEPGNARLWYQLGEVRLQQQRWSQAEQVAQKSIRLAGGDRTLQAAGWRLIAAARKGAGDLSGSQAAERQVDILR